MPPRFNFNFNININTITSSLFNVSRHATSINLSTPVTISWNAVKASALGPYTKLASLIPYRIVTRSEENNNSSTNGKNHKPNKDTTTTKLKVKTSIKNNHKLNASVSATESESITITTTTPINPAVSFDQKSYVGYIVKENYKAPRGAIVLCHGLFGFDKLGPSAVPALQLHYWRGISDALTDIGCKVHVTRVGSVSSLGTRAQELRYQLEQAAGGQSVNLIGHSMGGLDARYMISHLKPTKFHVNTLTTISTPHRGSPFMDWCRDTFGVGDHGAYLKKYPQAYASSQNAVSQRPPLPTHPLVRAAFSSLDAPAFANLTTAYCNQILNTSTTNSPDVQYFSYGAATEIPLLHPLRFPYEIIRRAEGDNDGLVSVDSARWGTYLGTLRADHWELNNRWKPLKEITFWVEKTKEGNRKFDAVGFYLSVATKLAEEGF